MSRVNETPPPATVPERDSAWAAAASNLESAFLFSADEIIGESPQIRSIKQCIDHVAPTDTSVLITGETGTGKELFARRLHRLSNRRNGPLVSINCAAIPDSLLESELFGFEKGTFTGASLRYEGRFMQANGGTLFLDEIGDLSPSAQAKLLRVLEQKEVHALGSKTARRLDARIVAATNRRLGPISGLDNFRPDLFFRISVINVHIPPLRERKEDIPLIANHFIEELAVGYDRPFVRLSPAAHQYLQRSPWTGNVRELRNLLERAVLFSNGPCITEQDLARLSHAPCFCHVEPPVKAASPLSANSIPGTPIRPRKMAASPQSELNLLRDALEQTNWNKTKTAEVLRWSRMTIYRKISQYNLQPPETASSTRISLEHQERN